MWFFNKPNVAELKAQRNVKGLIKALCYERGDDFVDIRKAAAEALGEIGDRQAVEPLITALGYQSRVIIAAAKALGKIRDSRAVEPLISLVLRMKEEEEDRSVFFMSYQDECIAAITALSQIGDPRAIKPIISSLTAIVGSENRLVVAIALDKLGWQPNNDENSAAYLVAKKQWDSCVKLGAVAVKPLIHALKDEYHSVRQGLKDWEWRLNSSFKSSDTSVLNKLHGAKVKAEDEVRNAAAMALVKIGKPSVDYLIAVLEDEDKSLQESAIKVLGRLGDARAIEHLIPFLKNKDSIVKGCAMETLKKITGYDYGEDTIKWQKWFAKNKAK